MVFLVVLRVGVGITVFGQLPFLKLVCEIAGRAYGFAVTLDAHGAVDVFLGYVGVIVARC
jgi:hypothetical protein